MSRRPTRDTASVTTNGRGPSRLEDFVIISGFSGAGKSTAMNVFEDAGYFCVDNLPPEMIRSLAELFRHPARRSSAPRWSPTRAAASTVDALAGVLDELDEAGVVHRVLFLEADEQTLLTRYKETRRRHPLAPHGSVQSTASRPSGAARAAARARRLVHRHDRPERRRRCAARSPTSCSSASRPAGWRSRSRRSATSTARRATPTSRSTCASCRTRTTRPTCAR